MRGEQTSVGLVYFGKIPSRGDFVRSANSTAVVQPLDDWLTRTIELMATDVRWKLVYDAAAPTHFALFDARSPTAMAGHLLASSDASGRRFPFVTAGSFPMRQPREFIARSPLALARLWNRFESLARKAQQASDAAPVLTELSSTAIDIEASPAAYEANYADFLDIQTVGALGNMLAGNDDDVSVRRIFLGLGMLLEPLLTLGEGRADKALALPLPVDPLQQPFVATLWMDLMTPFVARGDFELALFTLTVANRPKMVVGFKGAAPATLHAVLDPIAAIEWIVDVSDNGWVEASIEDDYRLKKLSAYLQQPDLSLRQAAATFSEAFLGS